jgi:ATP-binding cassette subfamily B protein
MALKSFPFYLQLDTMDCGPTCLRMVARFHGRHYSLQMLRELCNPGKHGVSLSGLSEGAAHIGLHAVAVKVPFEVLESSLPLPCIAHWRQNHFVVIYKIRRGRVFAADPAVGLITYEREEFQRGWLSPGGRSGILLLLEPKPEFSRDADEPRTAGFNGRRFLSDHLAKYPALLLQLLLGIALEGILVLVFPFLAQALVDVGVAQQNIGFVYTILIAQLMLFCGRTAVDFIRSWILLHIGTRINVTILSDYLTRLMKLPMSFFDTKLNSDLLQRVDDHRRIEVFLTSSSLSVLFAAFNLLVCSSVLALYSASLFLVFFGGTAAAAGWIFAFSGRRRIIDFKLFTLRAENRSTVLELIQGMHEIKVNRCEAQRRWRWEAVQARLFRANQRSLAIQQYQQAGTLAINEVKNIVLTFLAAAQVVDGRMTLGMMLAISYMIGQVSGPLVQLLDFVNRVQDARLSLDRLAEVHESEEEEQRPAVHSPLASGQSLSLRGIGFRYPGAERDVIEDIELELRPGTVTAIVGASGSGKTTLLKLLLRSYRPTRGEIRLGSVSMDHISPSRWRERCGVVMQDGFVFSDTVARNVSLREDEIDHERLAHALRVANIHEFVDSLPLAQHTKIGPEGQSLSGGQHQRILIARAVMKEPEFLFFDEATSALDATNERVIMNNLRAFFKGRTVVIVAHRLSTVRDADQIVVLHAGRVVERGHHEELTRARGPYYHLVKNQLELGA